MSAVGDNPGLVENNGLWHLRCTSCDRLAGTRVNGSTCLAAYRRPDVAAQHGRAAGWLVLRDRTWCPVCRAAADCHASGHRYGRWHRHEHRARFVWRRCRRCGELDVDCSVDWDAELRRLVEKGVTG